MLTHLPTPPKSIQTLHDGCMQRVLQSGDGAARTDAAEPDAAALQASPPRDAPDTPSPLDALREKPLRDWSEDDVFNWCKHSGFLGILAGFEGSSSPELRALALADGSHPWLQRGFRMRDVPYLYARTCTLQVAPSHPMHPRICLTCDIEAPLKRR